MFLCWSNVSIWIKEHKGRQCFRSCFSLKDECYKYGALKSFWIALLCLHPVKMQPWRSVAESNWRLFQWRCHRSFMPNRLLFSSSVIIIKLGVHSHECVPPTQLGGLPNSMWPPIKTFQPGDWTASALAWTSLLLEVSGDTDSQRIMQNTKGWIAALYAVEMDRSWLLSNKMQRHMLPYFRSRD